MTPTDIEQIAAAVAAIQRAIEDGVLGIYQYGSGVSSGLMPMSDLDFLVVVDQPTSAGQRRDLVLELLGHSGGQGSRIAGRPLEVTVVRQDLMKPWRNQPEREFQYGEWLRVEYEAGKMPVPEVDQDLAPLLFTALAASKALVGPPLDQLIDPIPYDDLVASMRAGVPGLLEELADDTRNVLLTLARIWFTTSTGTIASKDEAAEWALHRLTAEQAVALSHARSVYLGEQEEDFAQTGNDVSDAASAIAAAILQVEGG